MLPVHTLGIVKTRSASVACSESPTGNMLTAGVGIMAFGSGPGESRWQKSDPAENRYRGLHFFSGVGEMVVLGKYSNPQIQDPPPGCWADPS